MGLVGRCLVNELFKRKMEFAGHVLRGSSEGIYNKIIEGKREKGRQRRNWIDHLKDWTDIKLYTLKRIAEDREMEVHGLQASI